MGRAGREPQACADAASDAGEPTGEEMNSGARLGLCDAGFVDRCVRGRAGREPQACARVARDAREPTCAQQQQAAHSARPQIQLAFNLPFDMPLA
jgi:hypothetical protein